jgi:hypothetical protein
MINLVSSFYISRIPDADNTERNIELAESLKKNIDNILIKNIHLYIDDIEALEKVNNLNSEKINIIKVGYQPLYCDFFKYAIENLNGQICMISNSDIYLYECEINILMKLDDKNIFALSRYEHDLSHPQITNYMGSHDCFIFKSPIDKSILENLQYKQNLWGSENVVLNELHNINLEILNPCFQIKIVHLHKSDLREQNRMRINHNKSYTKSPDIL